MSDKKYFYLILASIMLFSTANELYARSGVSASPITIATMKNSQMVTQTPKVLNSTQVFFNGKKITINDPIILVKGATMLPIKSIGKLLNCTTEFDNSNKVAIIKSGDKILEIPLYYSFIVDNGQVKKTSVASLNYDSKTYLPIRTLSENLQNVSITYFADTHTISITTDDSESINSSISEPIAVDKKGWIFMGTKEMHELLKKNGFTGTGSDINYSIKHKEYAHYEKVLIALDLQKDTMRLHNIKQMIPNIDFTSGIKRYQTENQEYVVIIGKDKNDLEKQVNSYQPDSETISNEIVGS